MRRILLATVALTLTALATFAQSRSRIDILTNINRFGFRCSGRIQGGAH
ncbi:MAG TPA: hypothetical protein VF088_18575 [Pyrinomonadaceae bacterium]